MSESLSREVRVPAVCQKCGAKVLDSSTGFTDSTCGICGGQVEPTFELGREDAFLLQCIAQRLHGLAKAKGWHPRDQSEAELIPRSVANLHGEASELWEAYRRGELRTLCDKTPEMIEAGVSPLTCMEEELADIIIRAMDTAIAMGVDIGFAIDMKHRFNATRKHRHGGKLA